MKKALLLTISDPSGDPRPRRTFHLLTGLGYAVDTVGYSIKGELKPQRHYNITPEAQSLPAKALKKALIALGLLALRVLPINKWREALVVYWFKLRELPKALKENDYAVIFVEDLFFLPQVLTYRLNAKVVFDAREYYTRQREDSFVFRTLERPLRMYLCKTYLKQCDKVITVSQGLANEYAREFGIKAEVIRSTPTLADAQIQIRNESALKMIHHGVANRNRRIENMIDLIDLLDERFTLDIYLQGNASYIEELKTRIGSSTRVRILEPVKFEAIIPTLNLYDIGLFYVEPTTFNLTYCLPNKLFEFIQARLVVAIGPSPDMADIVNKYECGVVSPEFNLQSMAKVLNALDSMRVKKYKEGSNRAAEELNWLVESKLLENVILDAVN